MDRLSYLSSFIHLNMSKDRKTEMYVKFAKVMIIFQGPETPERISELKTLKEKFKTCGRILSDQSFAAENGMHFSESNTDHYHKYFQEHVKRACEENCNLVVISQSVLDKNQVKYFLYLAQIMQYVLLVVPPFITEYGMRFEKQKNQAAALNFMPLGEKYKNLFVHHFCGWFFHDVDSAELRKVASLYVKDCFENIDKFKTFFSNEPQISDLNDFKVEYNMINERLDLAYCVATILKDDYQADSYFKLDEFRKYYGKISKLFVVGFIVSPYIVAARILLTNEQRRLFQLNYEDVASKSPSKSLSEAKVSWTGESISLASSKCCCTMEDGRDIEDPVNVFLLQKKAATCHILLGKTNKASFDNMDKDVLDAVKRELDMGRNSEVPIFELQNSVVKKIGRFWFIYLRKTVCVNGFFSTCSSLV